MVVCASDAVHGILPIAPGASPDSPTVPASAIHTGSVARAARSMPGAFIIKARARHRTSSSDVERRKKSPEEIPCWIEAARPALAVHRLDAERDRAHAAAALDAVQLSATFRSHGAGAAGGRGVTSATGARESDDPGSASLAPLSRRDRRAGPIDVTAEPV
jgi:hypothetical protein